MSATIRASLDGHYKGMKTLVLENELIRMVALVDKGSDIIELTYKPKNVDILWHSPPGYRLPSESNGLLATSETGFLDCYGGGWQDALPTIGSGPTDLHGARFGLHGETSLLPWKARVEEDGASARAFLSVTGMRYPYLLEKEIELMKGENKISIKEKLTNTSKQKLEFYWIQHPSFGEPFLASGCVLELPPESRVLNMASINPHGRVAEGEFDWPVVEAKEGGPLNLSIIPSKSLVAEETTFMRVKQGWYSLASPATGLRFRFEWDVSTFPWVWFWQNYGIPDYPYYGDAWNVAVEPATSLPTILGKEAERDALVLEGGQSRTTGMTVTLGPI